MSDSEHARTYSDEERAAFRVVSNREWRERYSPLRGPAEYASGRYWPRELRRKAAEMERLIPLYSLAADALEREISTDPRGERGSTSLAAVLVPTLLFAAGLLIVAMSR